MVTENAASAWLGQQVGQYLDYDHMYGAQCFDFFNYYYQFITGEGPYSAGYAVPGAKDIWNVPSDKFDKIPDSSSLVPNVGDVLIYGSSWGGGYGHVEVCRWSDGQGCHVIGENEHGNPSAGVQEVFRTWASMKGLIGVMRPRFAPEPTPVQEVPIESNPTPNPIPSDPTPVESDPVPTQPSEPETPPVEETPADPATPVETTTPDPTPTEPTETPKTPPKVVVPEPHLYFTLWQLFVAIIKKLFGAK